jgi:hypothetical protein
MEQILMHLLQQMGVVGGVDRDVDQHRPFDLEGVTQGRPQQLIGPGDAIALETEGGGSSCSVSAGCSVTRECVAATG